MARENKLFEENDKKRLINTEYNILTKLDVGTLENDEMKKEDLRSLIDDIYEKEKPIEKEKPNNYTHSEEDKLLSDLLEDTNTIKSDIELDEDISKKIIDKEEDDTLINTKDKDSETIATQITPKEEPKLENSMYDFGLDKKSRKKEKKAKNLLEGVDLEKEREAAKEEDDYEDEKEGKGLVIAIVIVVILILLTCAFFVYEYFFGI